MIVVLSTCAWNRVSSRPAHYSSILKNCKGVRVPRKIVKPGGFVPAAKSVEMHISTLQIGMYVSKLDRDWLDTPFLLQGFVNLI